MEMAQMLVGYLGRARDALLWKVEGLSERELRLPRTQTGTNLLGLVKHCALVEAEYLGTCLGREHGIAFPHYDVVADPNIDLYATAEESAAELIERYRAVGRYVDSVVADLPLDTPARVPWWGDQGETTLGRLLVHLLYEVSRHAGQADILREGVDGAAGLGRSNDNLGEPAEGWPSYVAMLDAIANGFSES